MEQREHRTDDVVLFVAGNADLPRRMAREVARHGWAAHTTTADAALAELRARRYCIVLIDLATLGLDGVDLIRRVRRDADRVLARTPLMACAPYAGMGETALAAGADDYLVAPCVPSHAVSRMAACVRRRE